MLDRRTRVSDLVHEARQDLAYRPRIGQGPGQGHGHRGVGLPRPVIFAIVILFAAVLATTVVVVTQLPGQPPETTVALRRPVAVRTVQGDASAVTPTQAPPPPVAPLTSTHRPHLFVVAAKPLRSSVVAKVAQVAGVRAVERADAAEVGMDGKRVQTLGVNPSTFRAYTPKPTARSDRLWRNVSAGEIAVSFVLGNDGGMPLGKTFTTAGRTLRVGAYATMGMGDIDAVVSRQTARSLGIPENNALVVSAPRADSAKLRRALLRILPRGSQIATINPVLSVARNTGQGQNGHTVWSAGAFMTVAQVKTALTAAISKLGRPYVWGAEGPDTFDCSGLVQWAYAQAGVKVPRVTHQQFVSGPQIPLSQVQPGDLLFWRHDPTNPGYVSHVAIYWGNGKMLQAPRTGDVVKLSPVSTRNFAGAVRISPAVAARVR
ncbi:C40 family peptidase [Streptosporangium sp. CA-135522]|uniref:C40 family peptidase n=1 Tax=Streptosporangium sp. CA-135522 TaxID=3240072 RepID=UPI003D8F69D5